MGGGGGLLLYERRSIMLTRIWRSHESAQTGYVWTVYGSIFMILLIRRGVKDAMRSCRFLVNVIGGKICLCRLQLAYLNNKSTQS